MASQRPVATHFGIARRTTLGRRLPASCASLDNNSNNNNTYYYSYYSYSVLSLLLLSLLFGQGADADVCHVQKYS